MIRGYRPADRADVYDVCVRTAEAGGDARGLYRSDDFMPDVFAGPYLELEPELAFVVDDGRVVGYVLGTADTQRWAAEHRARWLPRVAARYPLTTPPRTTEEQLTDLLHHPERAVYPELSGYPAHLHIDLLPSHQGRGLGRLLIRRFLAALRERGVPGVHLGVAPENTRALAFYRHLGLREVPVAASGAVMLGAPKVRTPPPHKRVRGGGRGRVGRAGDWGGWGEPATGGGAGSRRRAAGWDRAGAGWGTWTAPDDRCAATG